MTKVAVLAGLLSLAAAKVATSAKGGDPAVFPAPFSRTLTHTPGQDWQLNGSDVTIAQHLLRRSAFVRPTTQCCSGVFDEDSADAVRAVQEGANLTVDEKGALDVPTAKYLLAHHSFDGYVDNGRSAHSQGYRFKIMVPVHSNRSIETEAQLLDADDTVLFTFPVRAHGHDVLPNGQPDSRPWPDYDNDNGGLNMFSSSGATPTGLSQADLNSPEDDPKLYGCVRRENLAPTHTFWARFLPPYPIVRVVQGVEGNAAFLLPFIRNGILLHTGEWPTVSPTMPNSAGCIHTHPDTLKTVGELLQSKCGVKVNKNTNGQLPYPYQPQGLISVFQVD